MSLEAIIDKFMDCAAYALVPIPRERLEKVIEMVKGLDRVDDISRIIHLLG